MEKYQTKFNLDEIKELEFINEEGEYVLKVEKFETREVNEKLVHSFNCVTEEGKSIRADFFITEAALFRYKNFIRALGSQKTGEIDVSEISPKAIGKKFKAVIKRKPPRENLTTGITEESKYFEIVDFKKIDA